MERQINRRAWKTYLKGKDEGKKTKLCPAASPRFSSSAVISVLFCFFFFKSAGWDSASSCSWSSTFSSRNGFTALLSLWKNNCGWSWGETTFNIEPRMPARLQKWRISHVKPFKSMRISAQKPCYCQMCSSLDHSERPNRQITQSFVSTWVKGLTLQQSHFFHLAVAFRFTPRVRVLPDLCSH